MATLTLNADPSELATVRDFCQDVSRKSGLPERSIYDLQLAVDEACSNVIQHAYGGRGGQIEITIEAIANGMQVVIRDWGQAFDLEAVPVPDVTAPLEARPLGGLGLFLIRQMMDSVEFRFDAADGNTLTMVKTTQGRGEWQST
jgi:serine/threonine-protein kinase RsbW